MTRSRRTIAIAAGLIGAVVISAYPIDARSQQEAPILPRAGR